MQIKSNVLLVNRNERIKTRTYVICNKYCAFCICSPEPVIVIIRSFDPGCGLSIVIPAPDCSRIC